MLGVLIALLVGLLILHFLRQLWSQMSYPPGPLRLPIIGSALGPLMTLNKDSIFKLAKEYGNIFMVWLGPVPVVILVGYETVKDGLINHSDDFADRPGTPFMKVVGKERGIVFSSGHTWKQQRKFGQTTLRKLGLGKEGMEHQIEEEAQQLVETFARAKGKPFDPAMPITNAIANALCVMAFGHRFPAGDKDFMKLMEGIHYGSTFLGSISYCLYEVFPWIMKRLPGPQKRAASTVDMVLSFVRNNIENHKEHHSDHEPKDFIDFYFVQMEKSKNDPNSTYNEDNLSQCIFDLFIAGTETASLTLRWGLLLLANHPDIQEKVHKEIEDVLGSSSLPQYKDRKRLPYTNAVIHEIQRFKYVLLFGLPRQCTKEVNMGGFLIPKEAFIILDIRSALLDPKEWETPEEFNPNHFLDKDGGFVEREAFLSFGAGARGCPGEKMARIELFLIITNLLRAFTFQPPEGVKELNTDPIIGASLTPRPYKLCALHRSSSS